MIGWWKVLGSTLTHPRVPAHPPHLTAVETWVYKRPLLPPCFLAWLSWVALGFYALEQLPSFAFSILLPSMPPPLLHWQQQRRRGRFHRGSSPESASWNVTLESTWSLTSASSLQVRVCFRIVLCSAYVAFERVLCSAVRCLWNKTIKCYALSSGVHRGLLSATFTELRLLSGCPKVPSSWPQATIMPHHGRFITATPGSWRVEARTQT